MVRSGMLPSSTVQLTPSLLWNPFFLILNEVKSSCYAFQQFLGFVYFPFKGRDLISVYVYVFT